MCNGAHPISMLSLLFPCQAIFFLRCIQRYAYLTHPTVLIFRSLLGAFKAQERPEPRNPMHEHPLVEEGTMPLSTLCGIVTSEVKAAVPRHHFRGYARRRRAIKRSGVVLRG